MAYKDKEKQRQVQREWVRQKRNKGGVRQESSTHPDVCQYCDKPIISLGYTRKYPGACYDCSLKPHPKTIDDLWPAYRYSNDSDYVMTAYEREHYKPANELADGEYNPVSKPGDSHYRG